MQRLVGIYTYTVHRCTLFLEFNITITERSHTERARSGTPDREFTFSLFRNVRSKFIVFGETQRVRTLDRCPACFCPYCGMLFCDTQKYSIGDDATTVVVVFCRQSHLGCTDMSLQQNRDKNA